MPKQWGPPPIPVFPVAVEVAPYAWAICYIVWEVQKHLSMQKLM